MLDITLNVLLKECIPICNAHVQDTSISVYQNHVKEYTYAIVTKKYHK